MERRPYSKDLANELILLCINCVITSFEELRQHRYIQEGLNIPEAPNDLLHLVLKQALKDVYFLDTSLKTKAFLSEDLSAQGILYLQYYFYQYHLTPGARY